MELGTSNQWKGRLERKSVRSAQPRLRVGKSRALSGAHSSIIMQRSHPFWLIACKDLEGSFHKGRGALLIRTRFGSRSSSISKPSSSRPASAKSRNASPKPKTNKAIA